MRPTSLASVGVYVFTCLLQAVLVALFALDEPPTTVLVAAVLSAAALSLHSRHLAAALRGRRPAHGGMTLAALLAVAVVGQVVVGGGWVWTIAMVGTSAVLVLPPVWGLAALVAVVVTSFVLAPFDQHLFFALTTAYRSVILVSVVWFVAAAALLEQERANLVRDAVIDERARIGSLLASAHGDRFAILSATARQARERFAEASDDEVVAAIETLAADARATLDETRRIVTALRADGELGELRAARTLLTRVEATVEEAG